MRAHRAAIESHVGIIDRSGGANVVAAKLQRAGCHVTRNTAACWVTRNSIPRTYWQLFETLGLATYAELELAYERRRALRAETRRLARGVEL